MRIAVPPLKCQGIKTHLVEWMLEHVSLSEGGTWIEPFMGSGAVGFNVLPAKAIFADVNPHIINLYNAIKSGKFNVPFGHKPERFAQAYVTKIINQIRQVSQALSMYDWQFTCADFRQTLALATEKDLVYCDPPYIGRHTDYFNGWSEQNEQDLFDLLSKMKAKFIISTWHSNQYRKNQALEKYAAKFNIFTREHFYHVGASEKNRNPVLEAIVLNYAPEPPQVSIELNQLALFEPKPEDYFHKISTE